MVGLGETEEEVLALLDDLRAHDVDYITIGQYLQPSNNTHPSTASLLQKNLNYTAHGQKLGFRNIWAAPMVRSSSFC